MNKTLLVLAGLALLAGAAAAETRNVHVYLHDYLHITPEVISAEVGDTLQLTVENPLEPEKEAQAQHDLVFQGLPQRTPLLEPGQSVPLTVPLDTAGTFEYYCSVPGHKEAGMVGTLVVQGGAPAAENSTPGPAAAGGLLALAAAAALRVRRP